MSDFQNYISRICTLISAKPQISSYAKSGLFLKSLPLNRKIETETEQLSFFLYLDCHNTCTK